jgi:hypothetical protein
MLVKYIRCGVDSDFRENFSLAQMGWAPLKEVPGFIRQFGGWSKTEGAAAILFGLWESRAAYQYFMDHLHDRLIADSSQEQYFHSIYVEIYEIDESVVQGAASSRGLLALLGEKLGKPTYEVELVEAWEVRGNKSFNT